MGLTYVESEYLGTLVHIEGTYAGYEVSIHTERGPHYTIELKHDSGYALSLDKPSRRPKKGQTNFEFRVIELDRLFGQSYALKERAQWVSGHGSSLTRLARFARRWGKKIEELQINDDRLMCSPKKGQPPRDGAGSLLPKELEELLPVLVELARELDAHPLTTE